MSKVLMIRHLPTGLSFQDKEQILKHFGAEKVWETSKKRNYTFASFPTVEEAKETLVRLHQLEIAERRLVVEYSLENEPNSRIKSIVEQNSVSSKHLKEFLKVLNGWNPSVDFFQPPPVNLKYSYPELTPTVAINILSSMMRHEPLYIQTLHLMNKMCLETPFQKNESAICDFKNMFRHLFLDELILNVPKSPSLQSEEESELSSDNEQKREIPPSVVKRKHMLPITRKRPAAMLTNPAVPKSKKSVVSQDVFETVTPIEVKKISLKVAQDALTKPSEEPKVVGEIGKFQKEEQAPQIDVIPVEKDQPTITKSELLRNRISYSDMKVLPVFKNYHPGQPSMRLYIKNLAKAVTEQDLKRIFKRYIDILDEDEQTGFDVRVMQEGRMKGQAFVTFPSEKVAEKALNETNGYLLHEKPMVVQFARAANKRTVN